jgi:hypothetical protein|tara:strand:+ start:184 stop:738 length:555 start_codon:yes stop_codon:yes gene_type:complete
MKRLFYLFTLTFLLNGCVESVALLGSSVGGASSGKIVQSSLQSTISYGIKKQTGKTPLGHAIAYAEKNNPEKKEETCISFIEKTRSEFCTIAKNKISSTNIIVKEKIASTFVTNTKSTTPVSLKAKNKLKKNNDNKKMSFKPEFKTVPKGTNYVSNFNQLKKSPRELAIVFQAKLKKLKGKYVK